jgi:hypothetical protein
VRVSGRYRKNSMTSLEGKIFFGLRSNFCGRVCENGVF